MTQEEKKNIEIICKSISSRKRIQFEYKHLKKVVEPYLIGNHKDNDNIVLRAYSVDGQSKSGQIKGWKLYDVTLMNKLFSRDDNFIIRIGYNPNDKDISNILCRV